MRILYTFGVRLFVIAIRISSLWNKKAKKWVDGRKNWKTKIPNYSSEKEPVYWFHAASLGEFEQGLPVMILIREHQPNAKIVVSFFSPSGYEQKKNHPIADYIFYLPADTLRNAEFLIQKINPTSIIFIKYEFWANLILTAHNKNVRLYLIAGLFRENQIFFKPLGKWYLNVLKSFSTLFVQNEQSFYLLKSKGIHSEITGDPRYERVLMNTAQPKSFEIVKSFSKEHTLVFGSIWKEDLLALSPGLKALNQYKFIVAPHELNEEIYDFIAVHFPNSIRYSEVDEHVNLDEFQTLIIDNIGMLMHLYQYGTIAYVGGAFKSGLHNILEPAAFGLPVIFGPNYKKFPEADLFISNGFGKSISNSEEFIGAIQHFSRTNQQEEIKAFMQSNTGGIQHMVSQII